MVLILLLSPFVRVAEHILSWKTIVFFTDLPGFVVENFAVHYARLHVVIFRDFLDLVLLSILKNAMSLRLPLL